MAVVRSRRWRVSRSRVTRRTLLHHVGLLLALVGAAVVLVPARAGVAQVPGVDADSCPTQVDASSFADVDRVEDLVRELAAFGLRMPATAEHDAMLEWLENELRAIDGAEVRSQEYRMTRWQPTTHTDGVGRDLAAAGSLTVLGDDGDESIDVAGAMAYTRPTGTDGVVGELVYVPPGVPMIRETVAGKIVLRDVPTAPIAYALVAAVADYVSPDMVPKLAGDYVRPYTVTSDTADLQAAHRSGAVGYLWAFDVPTHRVRGYFGSHTGTLEHIPGLWVGVDERERLEELADDGVRVRIDVLAEIEENVPTRNVIATIPGESDEKIVVVTNSDGNSWVQENGVASLIVLAEHFAGLEPACRNRTVEFAFTSAHLGFTWDGTFPYADELLEGPEDVSFVFAVEHLGTREILPVPRQDGPGHRLEFTGEPEFYPWFAPIESPALSTALISAVAGRGDGATAVLRGIDAPEPGRFPLHCAFGGLANNFHGRLIPSLAGISGPWSMWAPAFGDDALDFERLHLQTLVVGDTILGLDDVPTAAIEGSYPLARLAVDNGASTCDVYRPLAVAPSAPSSGPDSRIDGPTDSAATDSRALSEQLPATGASSSDAAVVAVALLALAGLLRAHRSGR